MNRPGELRYLRQLQARIDALRNKLGVSSPNSVIYYSPVDFLTDQVVVVETDGVGGATTSIVEGNYPVDYITTFERVFLSEEVALQMAEKLQDGHTDFAAS